MSRKEVPRAGLLKAALAGRITNRQGATALGLSSRQFQRLKGRFRAEGARGLLHRARGRPSPRRLAPEIRERIGQLLHTTYAQFNDCHVTDKLQEGEAALHVSRATVRRLRQSLGLPPSAAAGARRGGSGASPRPRWAP